MPHPQKAQSIPSKFHSIADVQKAMLQKLKDSCLTAKDVSLLAFQPMTAQQVHQKLPELAFARAGFLIPYFELNGKQNCFYRFRYLEYDNGKGFGKLTHQNGQPTKHDIRYVQPAETLPHIYLPPSVPWAKLCKAATIPLMITEGELKAACACKHDLPTVGLGGVWAFKSNPAGLHILPMLTEFTWAERLVYICFDSDASQNPDVCRAEFALAHELTNLGAQVHICRIPQLDGQKTGIDDYIAKLGKDAFVKDVHGQAEPYAKCEELYKLNAEVVYVRNPGVMLKLGNLQRITPRSFVDHAYSDRIWYETVESGKTQKVLERCAPREWLKWPYRACVEQTTYRPGQQRFTASHEFNLWAGWGCEPRKGDVSLWLRHLEYIFADHADSAFRHRWFQQWLAYPLQFPGTKLNQAVVLWSTEQGTGKTIIGYTMKRIYGQNFVEINDRHLEGNFNSWAENRQFVLGDEIASTGERRQDTADRMKSIITQEELRINVKFIPEYNVPDCINYMFTSNHADAFFMEDTDRRFFVSEVRRKAQSPDYYKEFCDWAYSEQGAAAIFHHLLHLDLDGFDPNGHAPMTTSKMAMQREALRGPVEAFAWDLRHHRAETLRVGEQDLSERTLFTAQELIGIAADEKRVNDTAMLGRMLGRMKFRRVCNGNPIHGAGRPLGSRATDRLWAVVDMSAAERYEALTMPEAACIYLNERKEFGALKKFCGERKPVFPDWYKPLTAKF